MNSTLVGGIQIERPIFIGGTGRSGTTLLARLIGSHSSIFGFHWETQFIVAPGGLVHLATQPGDEARYDRFIESLRGRWFERTVRAGTPGEYRAGLSHDISRLQLERAIQEFINRTSTSKRQVSLEAARSLILNIVTEPLKRHGAARWSEKTPRNILYTPQLLALFPQMKVIHIIRDGRDVASSVLANGFWPIAASADLPELARAGREITPESAARYWSAVISAAREKASVLSADQYFEIHFEHLIRAPAEQLERVFAFIGEPFEPMILARHDFRQDSIGRWRQSLTPQQEAAVLSEIHDQLIAEGYDI